jgi:hypothetical protein
MRIARALFPPSYFGLYFCHASEISLIRDTLQAIYFDFLSRVGDDGLNNASEDKKPGRQRCDLYQARAGGLSARITTQAGFFSERAGGTVWNF